MTGDGNKDMREPRRRAPGRPDVDLPLFRGSGLMPGVDLSSSAALLDHMEADRDCALFEGLRRQRPPRPGPE